MRHDPHFPGDGDSVPVTVIEALPNRVTTVKTAERDGYRAVQVTVGAAPKAHRSTRPRPATSRKAKVSRAGAIGVSARRRRGRGACAGRGAQGRSLPGGSIRRRHGHDQGQGLRGRHQAPPLLRTPMSHGNSLSHRAPGSIGQRQTPGRVFPGKRMAGRLGDDRDTKMNLEVVASTPNAICCSSRARFRAARTARSSCVRRKSRRRANRKALALKQPGRPRSNRREIGR